MKTSEFFPAWSSGPILIGERVYIRPVQEKDVHWLQKWWNDPAVMFHVGYPNGLNIHAKDVFDLCRRSYSGDVFRFIILEREKMVPIGEMNYYLRGEGEAGLGIKIGEIRYQEMRYGTEALELLLRYLPKEMCVSRIRIEILDKNLRSRRLFERANFTYQGLRPEPYLEDGTGRRLDVRCYLYEYSDPGAKVIGALGLKLHAEASHS